MASSASTVCGVGVEENAPMKQINNKGDHVKTSKKKFPLIFDQIGWNSFPETQG